MILGTPTKYSAGITIYGDYNDLSSLRDTVLSLCDQNPLKGTLADFAMGLAYDLRHAYQKDREVRSFGLDEYDKVTYRGVSVLWPVFLVQLGLLRWAAGFTTTTKDAQSNLYRLEASAENALTSCDPIIGKRCLDWVTSFCGFPTTYLIQYVFNCSLQYVTVGKAGKTRFKRLPEILRMILPLSPEYRAFREYLTDMAKEKNCRPEELDDWGEWPEFKW